MTTNPCQIITIKNLMPSIRAIALSVIVLASAGCERAIFSYANRGVAPPNASVVFDVEHQLSLDVYRPQGQSKTAPVVVFFYGGSWQRGSRKQYAFVGKRLAENGILAVVADYRTFPQAKFPGFMDDAAKAVAWSKAHAADYGGDPGRLFIAGHSAGAQIAALLGTDKRYLARAGMPIAEVKGVIGLSGPYDFVVGKKYAPIFDPPSQYPDAQAINFVDGDEPPFLLIHGNSDRIVEAKDSVELADKLRARGGRATLILLPDSGHFSTAIGLYDPERTPQVLPAILEFVGVR